ncbi:unnamed protein product [Rotaria magnacalcarata]|uniref:TIR domain-containing protein n=4 Tax=Rotaria magnacalcarata TaxID=392030 RepID=A0A816VRE6_9BILA|nr:unnamed protein product [Rotaria magnacalcarata]CAF1607297.1 unnamed protein product [Rotaria magnacalcarata]CAF2126929.1 unnamed protein product [Rotaria magnacalcarata]CAF2130848.1 unnamed protein product [Rotaria magnacalcarata]CAF2173955.1 unnamed protein product [Rotaria magnacalcarata]
MSNKLALNVEYQSDYRRIVVEQPFATVAMFKKAVRDEFSINHPFVLTYNGATLIEKYTLLDLGLDSKCDIRVRRKSVELSEATSSRDNNAHPSTNDIFLSYEWTHQREVKLLKSHLARHQYTCWLDIEQMRGGDALYSSIDQGIREAKVFVCCINRKYAESDNCRRELGLATNLNKPIVPLLMEKLPSWPPQRIGPLLSEYLYIKFYGSSSGTDSVPWSEAKFNELLDVLTRILPQAI